MRNQWYQSRTVIRKVFNKKLKQNWPTAKTYIDIITQSPLSWQKSHDMYTTSTVLAFRVKFCEFDHRCFANLFVIKCGQNLFELFVILPQRVCELGMQRRNVFCLLPAVDLMRVYVLNSRWLITEFDW